MLAVSDNTRSDEEHSLGGMYRETVLSALKDLSPDQQHVLQLAYFEGLTQEQIAGRMAIPLELVREATCQALRRIHSSFLTGGFGADTL